jgi:uncharacterized membrane-anchored protein YjiN (DUF445 family)
MAVSKLVLDAMRREADAVAAPPMTRLERQGEANRKALADMDRARHYAEDYDRIKRSVLLAQLVDAPKLANKLAVAVMDRIESERSIVKAQIAEAICKALSADIRAERERTRTP